MQTGAPGSDRESRDHSALFTVTTEIGRGPRDETGISTTYTNTSVYGKNKESHEAYCAFEKNHVGLLNDDNTPPASQTTPKALSIDGWSPTSRRSEGRIGILYSARATVYKFLTACTYRPRFRCIIRHQPDDLAAATRLITNDVIGWCPSNLKFRHN